MSSLGQADDKADELARAGRASARRSPTAKTVADKAERREDAPRTSPAADAAATSPGATRPAPAVHDPAPDAPPRAPSPDDRPPPGPTLSAGRAEAGRAVRYAASSRRQEGRARLVMSASNTTTISSIGAPNRRNTELALLVFAVAIPVFAYANVGLAKHGSVPAGLLGYGARASAARRRRPPGGAQVRAVRRPADAADRHPAQRPRPGADLAARPGADARAGAGGSAPNQLMWSALGVAAVRRRAGLPQGPPHPPALHVHLDDRWRWCC